MSIRGIDISDNNGTLDWDIIKEQIDFAMVRVGYGSNYESQDDRQASIRMLVERSSSVSKKGRAWRLKIPARKW